SSLDSLLAATSDLLTEDIYRGILKPGASNEHLFKVGKWVILGLGLLTWVLCLPRMTTLGELLNFTGAFVASTIWPIVFGLYRPRLGGLYAGLAMLLGTLLGLIAFVQIGFYVAALTSCLVSLVVCLFGLALYNEEFNWERLQRMEK
ncbi:MAG: urea transporter, partial [Ketobacter sp.]